MSTTIIILVAIAALVILFLLSKRKAPQANYTDSLFGVGKTFGLF